MADGPTQFARDRQAMGGKLAPRRTLIPGTLITRRLARDLAAPENFQVCSRLKVMGTEAVARFAERNSDGARGAA